MTFLTNAKGEPLLLLGTQTHNSSVGDPEMMARELAAVKAYGGNLLEAPIYWYKLEREPGQYDFSDVDDLLSISVSRKQAPLAWRSPLSSIWPHVDVRRRGHLPEHAGS